MFYMYKMFSVSLMVTTMPEPTLDTKDKVKGI